MVLLLRIAALNREVMIEDNSCFLELLFTAKVAVLFGDSQKCISHQILFGNLIPAATNFSDPFCSYFFALLSGVYYLFSTRRLLGRFFYNFMVVLWKNIF
ncbi:hypothetical protein ACM44_14225 [Chryseobacterium koreense CCUG 49689]|uniref:Uncharacterized protein n=1 Tax=Chryseobacterium koreense CCUG 49689 TaxID=1304281 RepID=A0A0J7LLZ6_9FLAO|nr:hypothetical protein ACM44_14225 [Chryseobacterium koreense CCUG 49689]